MSSRSAADTSRAHDMDAVLAHIDGDQVVQDTIDMVDIPSPTGSEAQMAEFVAQRYRAIGLEVHTQEVEPGRQNVIGVLRGEGGAASLQFDGHLDVSFTGTEDFMHGGASGASARVDEADGETWIFGAGSYNMKSALAAYMGVASAIVSSGVRLGGDVVLTASCGEIEATQVGEFTGAYYRGNGVGAAYMSSHGIVSDFAILGEPTELAVSIGHFGSHWTEIRIDGGTVIHTAHSVGVPNVIEQLPTVLERLASFRADFAHKGSYRGYEGVVNLAAVSGGRPWKSSRTPDSVSLFLDVRYPPGWTPLDIKAEIDRFALELSEQLEGFSVTQVPFNTNPPTEIPDDSYVVRSLLEHHQAVFGTEPKVDYQRWYSNAPSMNANGTHALNYGSAGSRRITGLTLSDKDREYVHVGDLIDITRVYTRAALDICSKPRHEVRPDLTVLG